MIRLVVCMDFDTDDVKEAYAELRGQLDRVRFSEGWETSDEWYEPDGELGSPEKLSEAILAYNRPKYNHAFDIAFSALSNHPTGEDVSGAQLRRELLQRIQSLTDEDLVEACGAPFDTDEVY